MQTQMKAKGTYRIIGRRDGKTFYDRSYKNVVTQQYFDALFKFMDTTDSSATVDDLKINVFAIGTGTAAATKNDIQLGNEIFRKSVTDVYRSSTFIQITIELTIAEGALTFSEIGLFANADVGTPDDGTLISHKAIEEIAKTADEQYTIIYTFDIQEA